MTDQDKLKKYQDLTMEMLEHFKAFCSERSLTWMMAGGSALGALRHGGFIPWDDDVDLAMPRADFEKLEELMQEKDNKMDKFLYSPVEAQLIAEAPIGHLYYPGVTDSLSFAPKLDIHPMDGVPEDIRLRKKQRFRSLLYYLGVYHHPTKNKGAVMKCASSLALKLIPEKKWKKIIKNTKAFFTSFDFYSSENVCSLFGAAGYYKEIVPLSWMVPVKEVLFNGTSMPVPAQADKYLEKIYGDWKEFPSENERHPVHDSYKHLTV